jgi:5-methylcytosine-specific restriction endonuclease McrA
MPKKAKKKRKKKSERQLLTVRLDTLCRKIVRIRDDNKCQRCLQHVGGSNSQPSHVIPKGNGASLRRFDLLNIYLSCNACHRRWHLDPIDASAWFKWKWPARANYLDIYRCGRPAKITTPEMRDLESVLKKKLFELEAEQ